MLHTLFGSLVPTSLGESADPFHTARNQQGSAIMSPGGLIAKVNLFARSHAPFNHEA